MFKEASEMSRIDLKKFVKYKLGAYANGTPATRRRGQSPGPPPQIIQSFAGRWRSFDPFWPCEITVDGIRFPSAGHALHGAAICASDKKADFYRNEIASIPTQKQLRQYIRPLILRLDWPSIRRHVCLLIHLQKLARHEEFARALRASEHSEIKWVSNRADDFWGVYQSEGENILGQVLMEVRTRVVPNPKPLYERRFNQGGD